MFNLSSIMHSAWRFVRKLNISIGAALRMAWHNAKQAATAKEAAAITEESHSWSGWKALGYEVIHESKALYKAILADPTTKSGTRIACYFGASQVQPIEA